MDFDTEKFIKEIQCRPVIWNAKCPEYSDKNLRQKAWEELVNIYGAESPTEVKQQLGFTLQKKWRNIRDCFVKTHKAKESRIGAEDKKVKKYMYYNNLLFMKDTVAVNTTAGSEANVDVEPVTQNEDSITSWGAKRCKKMKNDELVCRESVGSLSRNVEKINVHEDGDHLFFLSLVKEFKKVPESIRMQTKIDILKVIKDAQTNSTWDYLSANTSRGRRMVNHPESNSSPLPVQSFEVRRGSSQEMLGSPSNAHSPSSTQSEKSLDSDQSYLELCDSIQGDV